MPPAFGTGDLPPGRLLETDLEFDPLDAVLLLELAFELTLLVFVVLTLGGRLDISLT